MEKLLDTYDWPDGRLMGSSDTHHRQLLASPGARCLNTCYYASGGSCEDGAPGSEYSWCWLGTDCADCGPRMMPPPPPLSPPDPPAPLSSFVPSGRPVPRDVQLRFEWELQ